MATCSDCSASSETNGHWRMFNPACLYCGARLLQMLGRLQIAQSEATARRKAALADWVKAGHSEAQIRALVKGPLALEPVPESPSKPKGRTGASSKSRASAALA